MRKILYSPGYGGGWTTWTHKPSLKRFMLEHPGLIAAVEAGVDLTTPDYVTDPGRRRDVPDDQYEDFELAFLRAKAPEVVYKFAKECKEMFGEIPFLGGIEQLKVAEVAGPVRIDEYDGSERIVLKGDDAEEWL